MARYAKHTGQHGNHKAVARDVYGLELNAATIDLPSHLDRLVSRVARAWPVTAPDLIRRHTLAPAHLPFLPPAGAEGVVASMRSDGGGDIHRRCNTARAVGQPEFLRYCPRCAAEQRETLGEPYWRRIDQFAGVEFCARHQCALVSAPARFRRKNNRRILSAWDGCVETEAAAAAPPPIETGFHRRCRELLDLGDLRGRGPRRWTMFYRHLAHELGLEEGGRVDHAAILDSMGRAWAGSGLAPRLPRRFPPQRGDWLHDLFRKHEKSFHPLRHLMVWSAFLPHLGVAGVLDRVDSLPGEAPETGNPAVAPAGAARRAGRARWRKLLPGGRHGARIHPRGPAERAERDRENVARLSRILASHKGRHPRPRLSKRFLSHQLPRGAAVYRNLKSYPATAAWLDGNTESAEDHRRARIEAAAAELAKQGKPVKRWRLCRLAGVDSGRVTPRIGALIERLVSRGGGG